MNAFIHLYSMYEEELYSNCHSLCQFYLANPTSFDLTSQHILFGVYLINANSLWEMKHYTESQTNYEAALLIRKTLNDQDNITFSLNIQQIILSIIESFSETEIKFRIAKCLVETHQFKEANAVLQTISPKQRPAKVSMLMCKIQQAGCGTDKNLILLYKEVLKKCPLAFECLDGLIELGVKGSEVNSFTLNVSSEGSNFEWLNLYIKALSEMHSRKYQEGMITLTSIDSLKTNPRLIAIIGESFYHLGDYERALTYLKRSYDLYPFMKQGIQKYALLCDLYKKTRELEQLVRPTSFLPYEYSCENWFVFATYLYNCGKFEKAQYFINKVINQYQPKNVDALILNAKILHGNKKSQEALVTLRQALKYEPYRFEVHRWIVEILMETEKGREAQNQAIKSLKILGESARTLTVVASTFLKNPVNKDKAKTYLYKALEQNEFYVKAVFFMAQILVDDKETKAAIKLLEKTSAVVSNVKISLMLADLHAKNKNLSAALENYTKVLNLDATNRQAMNGIMALGTKSISLESVDDDLDSVENSSMNKSNEANDIVWS